MAGSDGSGFPAALCWYFCYVSYYLSNQFMVNKIKFFFSSLKKTSFARNKVTKFGTSTHPDQCWIYKVKWRDQMAKKRIGLSCILYICSVCYKEWCGLRPSVLGQDRSEIKKSVLVFILFAVVLVLEVLCCVVKHNFVTLVVIMILEDTETFQVLFLVSLFYAWNITTAEINSGVHLLKS